jgi:selenocysteine lyase/cysteine desulfurase
MRFDSEMMPTRMVRKPFPVRVHDGAVSVDAAAHSIFSKKAVSMLNHVEAALMQHPANRGRGQAMTPETQQHLLEAARETARLQLLARRDRALIDQVRAAFPHMTEAEVVRALELWGGLS